MRVRLVFAVALVVFAAGAALRLLPPAIPESEMSAVTSLPALPDPAGQLRAAPLADDADMASRIATPDVAALHAMPRLVGVTAGREPLGHFELDGELITIAAGERIGSWHMQAVDAEGVTLEGPEGMIRLRVYRAETGLEGEY